VGPSNTADIVATGVADTQQKGVEVGLAHMAEWVAPDWQVSLTWKGWWRHQWHNRDVVCWHQCRWCGVTVVWWCDWWCSWYWHQSIVLNVSVARGECMVVPGWVVGVAKEYTASLPAAAGTRPHGLSTPEWMWLMAGSEVGRGLGDWIVASDVTVGLATGYGAVKDAGASLYNGVWRVADLGCISCCRGPINVCEASPEVRSFHGCCPDGTYGV